jgi:hypothetical protein
MSHPVRPIALWRVVLGESFGGITRPLFLEAPRFTPPSRPTLLRPARLSHDPNLQAVRQCSDSTRASSVSLDPAGDDLRGRRLPPAAPATPRVAFVAALHLDAMSLGFGLPPEPLWSTRAALGQSLPDGPHPVADRGHRSSFGRHLAIRGHPARGDRRADQPPVCSSRHARAQHRDKVAGSWLDSSKAQSTIEHQSMSSNAGCLPPECRSSPVSKAPVSKS